MAPGPQNPGFPATLAGGSIRAGHPAVADLGLTPGHKSIVFGASLHKLYVVLYDGSVATGFPVTLPAESSGSPAVGDLTGDGVPEIVVSYGSTFEPGVPGGVRAYRRDGTVLWDRPAGDFNGDGTAEPVITAPAIGNIDGDGANEVAWGSVDGDVYLVNGATGTNKPGFPVFVRDSMGPGRRSTTSTATAGSRRWPSKSPVPKPTSDAELAALHVLRSNGTERPGFPKCIDQTIVSSAAVGDIDGDGKPEIVVGTGSFYPHRAHQVYAWKCDGTAVPGWPVSVDGEVSTSPPWPTSTATGCSTSSSPTTTPRPAPPSTSTPSRAAARGSGRRSPRPSSAPRRTPATRWWRTWRATARSRCWCRSTPRSPSSPPPASSSPTTAARFAGSFSYFTETTLSHVVVDNFESDASALEVVAVSATSQTGSSRVWVWNPKVSSAIPWGAFHQNAKRTRNGTGTPSCQAAGPPLDFYTLAPCRVVDTRNPPQPRAARPSPPTPAAPSPSPASAASRRTRSPSPSTSPCIPAIPGASTSTPARGRPRSPA